MNADDQLVIGVMFPVEEHIGCTLSRIVCHLRNDLASLPEGNLQRAGSQQDVVKFPYFKRDPYSLYMAV